MDYDYKGMIIEMIEKIEENRTMKLIYHFIKSVLKEEQAGK